MLRDFQARWKTCFWFSTERLCVPSMFDNLEVKVLYPYRWNLRVSEAQGCRRKARSERSAEQRCEPMDKNRI